MCKYSENIIITVAVLVLVADPAPSHFLVGGPATEEEHRCQSLSDLNSNPSPTLFQFQDRGPLPESPLPLGAL